MTTYCLYSCRRGYNAVAPEISTPTNQCITLQIPPENTSNCQNTQRYCHCQRYSRSPNFRFSSIIGCIKHCNQNAEAVSTCQNSHCHLNQVTIGSSRSRCCPGLFQDSIFTVISSQERPTLQTQAPLEQTSPCLRQRSMSTSRSTHVLYISTGMDNNPSPLEQQCFKTCMSHQVIHSQPIVTQRQGHYHIAQLTTSTISNHTFYIVLNQAHCPPHQTGNCTYPQLYSTCIHTTLPDPVSTCNLENTCSYQSCSMNQCRNWGRTFHPVCQPNMQTNLCTFPLSSSLLCKTNHISIISRSTGCSQLRSISASLIPPTKKQSYQQYSITYAVYLHCFLCSFSPTQTMKPKSNQQITTNSNHFPTHH